MAAVASARSAAIVAVRAREPLRATILTEEQRAGGGEASLARGSHAVRRSDQKAAAHEFLDPARGSVLTQAGEDRVAGGWSVTERREHPQEDRAFEVAARAQPCRQDPDPEDEQ